MKLTRGELDRIEEAWLDAEDYRTTGPNSEVRSLIAHIRLQDDALRRIVTTVEECAESVLHIAHDAILLDSDESSGKQE